MSGRGVRYNRQLHPDERQWAKDSASKFAQFYEDQTGQTISADQAQQMLLASGYRMVDAAASAGPAPDGTKYATAFISQNAGNMFRATTAEYNNPFLYGNADHSLSPEQRALPGAVASPKTGLAIAAGLATAGLAPGIAAGIASIPGAPIFGVDGALGSGVLASRGGIGVITGAVNATSQYVQSGSVNPVDVAYAALAGAWGAPYGLPGNVAINFATGAADTATNNAISGKHDGIITGGLINGGAAAIGFGIGTAAGKAFDWVAAPTIDSWRWSATGIWSGPAGSNLFAPNNAGVIGAGAAGAVGSEVGTRIINDTKKLIGK